MAAPNQKKEDKVEKPPFGESPLIPRKKGRKKKAGEDPQEKGMSETPMPKNMTIGETKIKSNHIQILNSCTENGDWEEKTRNTTGGKSSRCGHPHCGMGNH